MTQRLCEIYHVSAAANRNSITDHGLDWRRMGAVCGIAGNSFPGADAVFLCEGRFDVEFFLRIARHASDVWAVDVTGLLVEDGPDGWWLVRQSIPPDRLRLARGDVPPTGRRSSTNGRGFGR
jgi:hypothetical protein